MEDLSNIQVVISFITAMLGFLGLLAGYFNKMFDKKLSGLYHDNRNQYKYLIVAFASDLHKGIAKTRDEFKSIFDIFNRYEHLTEKLEVENHHTDTEMSYIKEKYRELDRRN